MEILERFKEIISTSEKPYVIELGCCDSYHSKIMLDILQGTGKDYTYHLFEPNADLVNSVVSNLQHYLSSKPDNVKFFNEAIGAENGVMTFYKSGGQKLDDNGHVLDTYYGSSSIRKPKLVTEVWKDMKFSETTASVVSLDYHIERCNLKSRVIDFIWADIQGAEVDLIKGGKEAFKNVRYLYTEYGGSGYYEGEIGRDEIISMLPDFELIEDYGGDILLKNKII